MADQAGRLLPLRLRPARLLDGLLLVEADLEVHDQADGVDEQPVVQNIRQRGGEQGHRGEVGLPS